MTIAWRAAVRDRNVASLRYRVESPMGGLISRGHEVELFDPANADRYDTVIFSKTYSAQDRALAGALRARGARVVFDICDNHFYNPFDLPKYRQVREDILDMLSLAQQVVCATPCMARVIKAEAPWAPDPVVIGDAAEIIAPATPSLEPFNGVRLLWFGSHGSPNAPSGMGDLRLISAQLARLAEKTPVELVVCSNNRKKFDQMIAPMPVMTRYVDWSLDGFPGVLASADAVVIPISRNPFTACKTHNRLTLALRAGVPVIADGIESYREFAPYCSLDDWDGALELLRTDHQVLRDRALAARDHIDAHWGAAALSRQWEAALGLKRAQARPASSVVVGERAAIRCQGAVDARAQGAITGWVRAPSETALRFNVRLEADGHVIARAAATAPRPDLQRAGLADSDCGFVLPLPDVIKLAGQPCEVVVEETGWRFDLPPFSLSADLRGGVRIVFRDRNAAEEPRQVARASGKLSQPAFRPEAAAAARAVQDELVGELDRLSDLMDQARQAAARLIIAVGDDVVMAQRVLSNLEARTSGESRRLERDRELEHSGEDARAPRRLN